MRVRRASAGRRVVLIVGGIVVGLVVALVLVVFFGQRQLIYYPDGTPAGQAGDRLPGGEDVTLRTEDGLDLGAWLFPPSRDDRNVAVLVLPGNGGNRAGRIRLADTLTARGFTVLLLDYRGYAGNPGSPSEAGLGADARAGSAVLADRGFAPACTLYLGESLGTGVAARLARTHPPAGIVLRSPYPRFADVARANFPWLPADLILRDRYPLADDLAGSPVPVVVLAGRADELVPVALSAQVAESVPNLHREVILDGARHNDGVWQSDVVGAEVTDLADAATGACS